MNLEGYLSQQPKKIVDIYNLDGLKDIVLTADIDWAPDFCTEHLISIIEKFNLKINLFSTHKSEILLQKNRLVEVGIHPDFTRAIAGWDEKVVTLRELYPNAVGSRSHRNVFGQNVSDVLKKHDFKYDASVVLWNQPWCMAYRDHNSLWRFPYCWEDGLHLDMDYDLNWKSISLDTPGLKILNVHPVLIYLNCISDNQRRAVTSQFKDLTMAPKKVFDENRNNNYGIATFWQELLDRVASGGIRTHHFSELVMA